MEQLLFALTHLCKLQGWSPRESGLGLEAPPGQPMVPLALASGKTFFGLEYKTLNSVAIL